MVLAEHDETTYTEVQRAVYETAEEPKRLITYGGGHFDAYSRFFEETAHPARDWFVEPRGVAEPASELGNDMPLWNIYCSEGTYSNEDKRAFASATPTSTPGKRAVYRR